MNGDGLLIHTGALDEAIREGVGWLTDCGDTLADSRPDKEIIRGIHRTCEGGWPGFIALDPEASADDVRADMLSRYGAAFTERYLPA
jgi:hypothetical protein